MTLNTLTSPCRTHLGGAGDGVEASLVVLGRFGDAGDAQIDRLLRAIGAEVVPVAEEQMTLARDAALRFGPGRHAVALHSQLRQID